MNTPKDTDTKWNPAGASTWCRLSGELPQMNGNVVVMVDDSPDLVSSFFEKEIPSLPESLEVRLLQLPSNLTNDNIVNILQDVMVSLFPEIGAEFATTAPGKWVAAIKGQRAAGALNDRWIMIDRFHHVLKAPILERKIFSEILQQLAEIPSFGVIVGITTDSAVQMAALLNLIESKEPVSEVEEEETTPIPAILAESKANSLWATVGSTVLAVGVAGASYFFVADSLREKNQSLVVYNSGMEGAALIENTTLIETRRTRNQPLVSAGIQEIEPAGHVTISPEIPLHKSTISAETLDVAHIGGEPKFIPSEDSPRHEVLYFVAEAHCFGHGVEKNLPKGITMLKQSNEMGSEKAANLLGTCHSRGFGVVQDYDKAREFFETAINRGSKYAHGNLGVLYLRGLGVTKDTVEARAQFIKGAKAGDPVAAFFAAKCFEDGLGAETGAKNPELAVFWYLESAKGGHEEALAWCREHELIPEAAKTIRF